MAKNLWKKYGLSLVMPFRDGNCRQRGGDECDDYVFSHLIDCNTV